MSPITSKRLAGHFLRFQLRRYCFTWRQAALGCLSVVSWISQALAFLILALAETPLWLTLGSALFGLTMGLVITLQPLEVAYMFGGASFGRIYGPIYMSIRISSAIVPAIVGVVLAAAGGYSSAWIAVAASLGLAIGALPWALNAKGPQAQG